MSTIAIVVPIYNEAENLTALVERLNLIAGRLSDEHGVTTSYVFIDDGSRDGSFDLLARTNFQGRVVRLLQFSRNFGKEAALSAGIEAAADVDAIVMMDADLQHPPELVLDLVRIWRAEGIDSVYAYKEDRRASEGWLKSALTGGFYWIINRGTRFDITQNAGDFRLISRRFANALRQLPESERFMKGLYGWVGFQQRGVPMTPPPRQHGVSSFNAWRLVALSFDAMTSFTTAPLRLMGVAGLVIAGLSALYGFYIVIERLFFMSSGIGISSVLALVSFFGGIQMIFLGLLGEYIGKTVLEAKRRPAYLLAQDVTVGATPEIAVHQATDNQASP